MTESGAVTVRVDGERQTGRAVDLRAKSLEPAMVAAAVREESAALDGPDRSGYESSEAEPTGTAFESPATERIDPDHSSLSIDCRAPGTVYDHVGCIEPSMGLRVRTALAAAARSRGGETPHDQDLERIAGELADLTVPAPPDLQGPRERVAGTDAAVDRIRERVAALRGRVQAGRDAGRDVSDLEAELAQATRELSERETERAAAREALERAERLARESRDARERRRRLEDRRANLQRSARAHLLERISDEFEHAVDLVPGGVDEGAPEDPFAVDAVTAALAVGRVARVDAPLVLACERFETPESAAGWLDAPVIAV